MTIDVRTCAAVVALLAVLMPAPSSADAGVAADDQGARVVLAGARHPENPLAPYEYTRYYPSVLEIHRGQTVQWDMQGFHSVTFLEDEADANHRNLLRDDEGISGAAGNEEIVFPSGCGTEAQPCVVSDTDTFVNGPARMDFFAVIDLPAREEPYRYHCSIHPSMHGFISVKEPEESIPTQAEIDQAVAEQIAADSAAADALFEASQAPTFEDLGGGRREWTVRVGASTPDDHVGILAFMPATLPVAPGDAVRFTMDVPGLVDEIHTVTFPADAVVPLVLPVTGIPAGLSTIGFYPACDPDERAAGAPGVPWMVVCPAHLEVLLGPATTQAHRAPGDGVTTAATYHDSGILVPTQAPDWIRTNPKTAGPFPAEFAATFPSPGTFSYACLLHAGIGMKGVITAG